MNMNQISSLQTPFLQPDLLTVSSFISNCNDNGVSTNKEELEYFHKMGLLLPAVRVLVGVVSYKKIFADFDGSKEWRYVAEGDEDKFDYEELDPKTYYDRGSLLISMTGVAGEIRGFQFGNDGFLDWYKKRDMVVYPAAEAFIPWKQLSGGPSWSEDPTLFDDVSELMYAKHQMYTLKVVQNSRTLEIKNQGLFKTPEEWAKVGQKITGMYREGYSDDWIKQEVGKYNDFFKILNEIRLLRVKKNQKISSTFIKMRDDKNYSEKDAMAEVEEESEFFDREVKPDAEALLKKYDFDRRKLEDWRHTLLNYGSFGTGSRSRLLRPYVTRLDNAVLSSTEHTYDLVNVMSWFIEVLGGEGITAQQLILRSMKDHCEICHRAFEATRKTQRTCASPECIQARKNAQKKLRREQAGAKQKPKSIAL